MAEIIFREGTTGDVEELARLRWDFSPDEVAASGQSYEEFLAGFRQFLAAALGGDRWTIWVAEAEGCLVANIWVYAVPKVPRPGRFGHTYGYMTNVYAEPEVRNQRVGSMLMERVIGWAKEQRLELLIVWPSERSTSFYQRAGFIPSAEALELHFENV